MLESELLQVERRERIKCRERNAEQCHGDEDRAMVVIFQQRERVPAEPLQQRRVSGGFWRGHTGQQEGKCRQHQPRRRAGESRQRGSVGIQRAHQPAAGHPAHGRPGPYRPELALGISQARKNDGGDDAAGGRGAKRINLDHRQHQSRRPALFDAPGEEGHGGGARDGQPAQHFHRRSVAVCHGAED